MSNLVFYRKCIRNSDNLSDLVIMNHKNQALIPYKQIHLVNHRHASTEN